MLIYMRASQRGDFHRFLGNFFGKISGKFWENMHTATTCIGNNIKIPKFFWGKFPENFLSLGSWNLYVNF